MATAENMEQDVRRSKQQLAKEMHNADERQRERGPDSTQELQEENERLRQMIKELTQKIENR